LLLKLHQEGLLQVFGNSTVQTAAMGHYIPTHNVAIIDHLGRIVQADSEEAAMNAARRFYIHMLKGKWMQPTVTVLPENRGVVVNGFHGSWAANRVSKQSQAMRDGALHHEWHIGSLGSAEERAQHLAFDAINQAEHLRQGTGWISPFTKGAGQLKDPRAKAQNILGHGRIQEVQVTLRKPYNTPNNPLSENEMDALNWTQLRNEGYDGIFYVNNVEDRGSISLLNLGQNNADWQSALGTPALTQRSVPTYVNADGTLAGFKNPYNPLNPDEGAAGFARLTGAQNDIIARWAAQQTGRLPAPIRMMKGYREYVEASSTEARADAVSNYAVDYLPSQGKAGGTAFATQWWREMDAAGQIDMRLMTTTGGSVLGGAIGAAMNDENRLRGAALGVFTGATLGSGAGWLLARQGFKQAAMPARARAALSTLQQHTDFSAGKLDPLPSVFRRIMFALKGESPLIELSSRLERAGVSPQGLPRVAMLYPKSSTTTVNLFFRHGSIHPVTRAKNGVALADVLAPFGHNREAIDTFGHYLVAKRAVARGPRTFGDEASEAAQAAYDASQDLIRHLDKDPVFRQALAAYEGYIESVGQYAVKSGLWTPQQWAGMKASDALYVPFKRVFTRLEQGGAPGRISPGGSELVNVQAGVRRFTGSERLIQNPIEAIAEYTSAIIRRSDRYRVGASLFDAADQLGGETSQLFLERNIPISSGAEKRILQEHRQLWRRDGWEVTDDAFDALETLFDEPGAEAADLAGQVIWRNLPDGTREYGLVTDELLWRSLTSLRAPIEGQGLRRFLDMTFGNAKRIFTATTTGFNPRFFGGVNPVRDLWTALGQTTGGIQPKDIGRGWAQAIGGVLGVEKYEIAVREIEAAGVGGVSLFEHPVATGAVVRELAPRTGLDVARTTARRFGEAPIVLLERLGKASDMAPRISEFEASLRNMAHKVESGEWTAAELRAWAAANARDVTLDFSSRPGNPVLRLLSDYIPFFNPAIQAPVRLAEALGGQRGSRSRAMGWLVGGTIMAEGMTWGWSHLYPEYREAIERRPAWERAAYFLIPISPELMIRIPKTQEQGFIAAGVTAALEALVEKRPDLAQSIAHMATLRALPPGVSEAVNGELPLPFPGFEGLLENAQNRRMLFDTPVVPERMQDLPPAMQRHAETPQIYDLLSAGLRKLHIGGLKDVSPLHIQNVVESLLSQSEPLAAEVASALVRPFTGDDAPRQLPRPGSGLRNRVSPTSVFLAPVIPGRSAAEDLYYDVRERVYEAANGIQAAHEAGDSEGMLSVLEDYWDVSHPTIINMIKNIDERLGRLADMQDRVRQAFQQGVMDGPAARERLDLIKSLRQDVIEAGYEQLRTARETIRDIPRE
jgi:hypothetical protein